MYRILIPLLALPLLHSCMVAPPEPGLGEPVAWSQLADWQTDQHAQAWGALRRSCAKLADEARWRAVCRRVEAVDKPSNREARGFFEKYFLPHPVHGEEGRRKGLITGYYRPLLNGSFDPGGRYRHPIYGPPEDLLRLELDNAYPSLAGKQLRGRLEGRLVTPYPDRAQLEADPGALAGQALLWVDDPVDAFFLHVQGSGRVRLPGGDVVAVGFADHNGRPYRSIGRRLIETGELEREAVNLFSIRRWLRTNSDRARSLMQHNPRYVFFRLDEEASREPTGALGVPLTAGRSLAVDPDYVPLGAPVWLETSVPGQPDLPLRRLLLAQDTGGAIQGPTRGDVYWGGDDAAERKAGLMKQSGRMFVLLPRTAAATE